MACFLVPMVLATFLTIFRKAFPSRFRIEWLNSLLWGGVFALAAEHIISGELVLYPPFLTVGLSKIMSELIVVGVPITLGAITAWMVILAMEPKIVEKFQLKILK